MPLLRVSEPKMVDQLISDLMTSPDVVAQRAAPDLVVVNILGSFNNDALHMVTFLRVRAWEEAQRAKGVNVHVEIE